MVEDLLKKASGELFVRIVSVTVVLAVVMVIQCR
jgi:hypothetical protein